jgi:rifampicin phosphotransferase
VPGIIVLRPESGLFFANADAVCARVLAAVESSAGSAVVLDAQTVPAIDVTAVRVLDELAADLERRRGALRARPRRRPGPRPAGGHRAAGLARTYPTVREAVAALTGASPRAGDGRMPNVTPRPCHMPKSRTSIQWTMSPASDRPARVARGDTTMARKPPSNTSWVQAAGNRSASGAPQAAAMDRPSPSPRPGLVDLAHPDATDPSLTGAKAANLAIARHAGLPVLPGMVLTTAWDHSGWSHPSRLDASPARTAWRSMSDDGSRPVVVRSSSTNEDGGTSSMAGVFTSVLDVADTASFVGAVDDVLASARHALIADAPMAVLVQPQLDPRWGGVLFGADPITGRTDRLLVSAVDGGPDRLVSGLDDGWTAVLSTRGRIVDTRNGSDGAPPVPAAALRSLAKLAQRAATAFGGPQDIEWAIDGDGTLWLLQSRPITTPTGRPTGAVLGAGPLAETFPDALSPLEVDLWLSPLRAGLEHALTITGTVSARSLQRTPVAQELDGWAVADLETLGTVPPRHRILRKIDPRPGARRLRAAWRVGRLGRALPLLARDVIAQVDSDLIDVPPLDQLSNAALLAVVDNGRTMLQALHGYEALAGMLIPDVEHGVTAASIAMSALAEARAEDVDLDDLTRDNPVVLALIPPRVGPDTPLATLAVHNPAAPGAPSPGTGAAASDSPDTSDDAVVREALRLRARWVQELTARAAWELGCRLVSVGVLPAEAAVRLLTLTELRTAALRRVVPGDLADRTDPSATSRPLPARFRLTADRQPIAIVSSAAPDAGIGAGGGVGSGPAHLGTEPSTGSVLVVTHLDPRLATAIPRLAGLVAESGSPLSHLAILAREHQVPTVVGHVGATTTYREGQRLEVDGSAGTVRIVDAEAGNAGDPAANGQVPTTVDLSDTTTIDVTATAATAAPAVTTVASTPCEIGASR